MFLLGLGTVVRHERDARSMVKRLALATNEYVPSPRVRQAKKVYTLYMENRNELPNHGGVSFRSRNGARSRKGGMVNGQMTKASKKYAGGRVR